MGVNQSDTVWKFAKEPVSEESLHRAEMALGVILPQAVKEVYLHVNGGGPRPNRFETTQGREVRLRYMLPVGEDYPDNFVATNKRMRQAIPDPNLVLIANDDFGNFFCVDTKMAGRLRLFFWHHESQKLEPIRQRDADSLYSIMINQ